jgi:outer membrane protein W
MIRKIIYSFFIIMLAGIFAGSSFAEDIEKKWQLSFGLSSYTTQDEIRSDADNRAFYIDATNTVLSVGVDPRPDAAATNVNQIEDAFLLNVAGSYAFNSWFLLELRVGYSKSDVGDLEVTALFDNDAEAQFLFDERGEFLFRWYSLDVGELTRIPIQLTPIIRFRPKSNFNPYLGLGVGYIVTNFESSSEMNTFSSNIDQAVGAFLSAVYPGGAIPSDKYRDLGPATVEAPDSWEYHFLGGLAYTFRKHWAVFIDAQYVFASNSMKIRVDGLERFGIGFPDGEVELTEGILIPGPIGQPYRILSGGGIDFDGDGVADPGSYYVQGGDIKYGGFSIGAGIKYTF